MWFTPEKGGPLSDTAGGAGTSFTSSVKHGVGPPSYPPSEVRHWMVCPTFWRDSLIWEPRVDRWTPHALVGTAIHAGIATLLHGLEEEPELTATRVLGEGYVEQETWSLLTLSKLVEKGYRTLRDAIQERFQPLNPVMIEQADPNQDNRIVRQRRAYRVVDFVRDRAEGLEVIDWKTKINLDDIYLGEALRSVMHSWQLLDYAWHVQQWTGRPVVQAGYGLVVLGPGKPKVHWPTIRLTPERLTQWHEQAQAVWATMWQVECLGHPTMNFEACEDRHLHFGKECFLLPGCHQLCGNQELYPSLYKMKAG